MSWGQIKHAINNRLDVPLNRQLNSYMTQVLTVGGLGDNNTLESEMYIEGPGVFYDIGRPANGVASTVTVIVDDQTILDSVAVGTAGNQSLALTRGTGAYAFATAGTFQPVVFNRNLTVRLRRSSIEPTPNFLNAIVYFEKSEISVLTLNQQMTSFRRLIFNSSDSVTITTPIQGNTARLYMIGRGGDAGSDTVRTISTQLPGRFESRSGTNGATVITSQPLQQGNTVTVNFLPNGNVQFVRNGNVEHTALRGTDGNGIVFLQENHHQGGEPARPTGVFAGAGDRGDRGIIWGVGPNMNITVTGGQGRAGRAVLDFDVV